MRIRAGTIIIFSALLLIVMTTLYPFVFSFRGPGGGLRYLFVVGTGRSDEGDVLNNILLFIPLGIGLGKLFILELQRKWTSSLGATALASFGLSYMIEALQMHIPSRFPSIMDVLANTAGGILGFSFFLFWYGEARSACVSAFVKKHLFVLSLSYVGMVFFVTISFASDGNFKNWDKSFTLLLGNEATGDRPWQGCISEAYIANRAITQEEVSRLYAQQPSADSIGNALLVSYRFAGAGNYHDRFNHLPALIWRGTPPRPGQDTGVCLGPDHWLETAGPASFLTERISASSEITVGVAVITDRITQTGPARIISLSADPWHRNFTLGQQGRDLHVRLRTPLTDINGTHPPLVVHNVFSADRRLHLIITYNRAVLSVYVDGILSSQSLGLSPDSISLKDAIQGKAWHLASHKLCYYLLIFLPFGILIAFVTKTARNSLFACIAIAVFSSLLIEGILSGIASRDINIENIILSILIAVSAVLVITIFFKGQKIEQ